MCALYKAYTGERAWKAIGDRLQAPSYLIWSIIIKKSEPENKEQSSGNTLLNKSITNWNLLPEEATDTSHGKMFIFKTRVRKVKTIEGK
jgi:hypothetical protein